ncbi:hypothetical protein [Candidatus Marithrix sp. Canyon 246]|uniref:hypothetical protein n=1 Tax=Candidatus Marithrix sp. Canyon 246 TaxID=1827136 RepID=UPI00084A1FAD|nr:hypothetical protein [Candidatus Marithrix sp. Canyon 246]
MKHLKSIIPAIAFLMLAMTNVTYAHESRGSVVDNSPYLFYATKATGRLSQKGCLNRAKKAMKRSKVRVISSGRTFVVGTNGAYKGTIICSSRKKQAIILVSGSNRAKTAALRTKIKKNFRR